MMVGAPDVRAPRSDRAHTHINKEGGPHTIAILGHVGNGNLGDEAIITAVVQNLRSRCPGAELYAFTANPRDTAQRHGVTAFPLRRHARPQGATALPERPSGEDASCNGGQPAALRRSPGLLRSLPGVSPLLSQLRRSARLLPDVLRELGFLLSCRRRLRYVDLLIVAGSGQLFDGFGGSWAFPYTLFKWSVLARASRAKLAFLSVGAGPIDARLSRFFIRRALGLAHYHSYRDKSSQALIESLGVAGLNPVVPDLAFSLRLPTLSVPVPPGSRPVVGINPMAYAAPHYWPTPDADAYATYVQKLTAFALWLVRRGYTLRFFPTQIRADAPVVDDIATRVTATDPSAAQYLIREPVATLEHLFSQIAASDMVIATRYHGILLSCLLGKPVLALSYHRKSTDLMASLGQSAYVLDVTRFDVTSLIESFTRLEGAQNSIRDQLDEKLPVHRATVARQYEAVLEPRRGRALTAHTGES